MSDARSGIETIEVICDELPAIAPSSADGLSNPAVETVAVTLFDLLPRGPAWRTDEAGERDDGRSLIQRYWTAVAEPVAALYRRAWQVTQESTAGTVGELLDDWEEEFGLPDPCIPRDFSRPERVRMLRARVTAQGGASREYFICLAAFYGYDIRIREFRSLRTGIGRCGDARYGVPASETIDHYWAAVLRVKDVTWFRSGNLGSRTGINRLGELGDAPGLECILTRWKPAHTEVVFRYVYDEFTDFSDSGLLLSSTAITWDRVTA